MRSSLSAIDYSGVVNRDTILVVDVRALTDRNFDFRQSASKNPSFKCCVCAEAATQHWPFLAMVSKWGPAGAQNTGPSAQNTR